MQLIPFTPKPVASRKQAVQAVNSALTQGISAGFPVVSIKGKVFHLVRGDERTLITKPGEEDPAPSLELVLLAANPDLSRTYYSKGFEEGSTDKPTCYSNDGKTPAGDAMSPQAKSCAACPHSVYGSRISENGSKGWACSNFRRLAVAVSDRLDDPMLIRVPGASLKALASYAKELDGHGYAFTEVVTKIGFDYSVAHPALVFKAAGLVPPEYLASVAEAARTDLVGQIIGVVDMPSYATEATDAVVPESVAALPRKAKTPAAVGGVAEAKHAAATAQESENAKKAEPDTPKPKAAAKAAPKVAVTETIDEGLDALLGDVNFDD